MQQQPQPQPQQPPPVVTTAASSFQALPQRLLPHPRSQKLDLPKGRIHIHHLTARQRSILKTVAAMQEMSMSAFIAEATLAVLRKLRMHGPKEVKHFLRDKVVNDEMQELRMQIP